MRKKEDEGGSVAVKVLWVNAETWFIEMSILRLIRSHVRRLSRKAQPGPATGGRARCSKKCRRAGDAPSHHRRRGLGQDQHPRPSGCAPHGQCRGPSPHSAEYV